MLYTDSTYINLILNYGADCVVKHGPRFFLFCAFGQDVLANSIFNIGNLNTIF